MIKDHKGGGGGEGVQIIFKGYLYLPIISKRFRGTVTEFLGVDHPAILLMLLLRSFNWNSQCSSCIMRERIQHSLWFSML